MEEEWVSRGLSGVKKKDKRRKKKGRGPSVKIGDKEELKEKGIG